MKAFCRPVLFSLTCFLLACISSFGQVSQKKDFSYIMVDNTRQKWGDWNEPDWLRYFGLAFSDVNRDGLKDIISGRYVYKNPGDDMTDNWERIVLDDNVDGILSFDVDDDPFADLIAQALPNVYWYEAIDLEGTKYTRKQIARIPATTHVNSQGFEIAQIVKGGKSEILIAGNGNIYCISVPTETNSPELWPTHLICPNTSDEGIGTGDIDGDGEMDIACGRRPDGEHEPSQAVWFKNPGTIEIEWESNFVGQSTKPMDRFKIGDLNGDKAPEIIVTEERYPGLEPDAEMYFFVKKKDGVWKKNTIVTQYSMNNLDLADYDKDGDLDLITNEHKGPNLELQIWDNDGAANFSKRLIDTGKENHLGTKFIDLDNDGDLDIAGIAWDNYKHLHVWRNNEIKSFNQKKVFKEYKWFRENGAQTEPFLRVGGKLDYQSSPKHFKDKSQLRDGAIRMAENMDLDKALFAELTIEKLQSHDDTKNLMVKVNNSPWMKINEPPTIPQRAASFMHHFSPTINLPLEYIGDGYADIKFRVDDDQRWGWPQNIIYGLTIHIVYDQDKTDCKYQVRGISNKQKLGNKHTLSIYSENNCPIKKVDYLAFYKDHNVHGDGVYQQWQFSWFKTKLHNHIGTATKAPFEIHWDTQWLPDQQLPMKICARIELENGLMVLSDVISDIELDRNHSVFLAAPYKVPENWSTREARFTEFIYLPMDPKTILDAQLMWRSWSPGYSEGITLNDVLIHHKNEWPHYRYMEHQLDIDPVGLKKGENSISTLKTALHEGKMVHGMEVQWPGIQLKAKTNKQKKQSISIDEVEYQNREHLRIETRQIIWYLDKAGGGFSRMIDRDGNDWISFKMEPWGEYPAAAASAFRGFPNLVFKGKNDGAGHPGHNKCKSWIEGNKVYVQSLDESWKWCYSFQESHVELELLKVPENEKYWVLYEGTPGGKFSPNQYFFGTSEQTPSTEINDFYKGNTQFSHYQWIFVGSETSSNTLFMAQLDKDKLLDMYGFLGNTTEGLVSKDGMTVFGFGRDEDTKALMNRPQNFIMGLYPQKVNDKAEYKQFKKYIDTITK